MFAYLSDKKVPVPDERQLLSIAWNEDLGLIACGGEYGYLKIIEEDSENNNDDASIVSFSKNQTLNGHKGSVIICAWNPHFHKLASSDRNGLIIVWSIIMNDEMNEGKGRTWREEMINDRSNDESFVADMKWTSDGRDICIAYQDGMIIVGSVEGKRIWGKELNADLRFIEWSPGSRYVIAVVTDSSSQIFRVYNRKGNHIRDCILSTSTTVTDPITGFDWYDGSNGCFGKHAPDLAISFKNTCEIRRGLLDNDPTLINASMDILSCRWNPNGHILALHGTVLSHNKDSDYKTKVSNIIKFYDPRGRYLHTLTIPENNGMVKFIWQGCGHNLKMIIAAGESIYRATIKTDYKYAMIGNADLVFAHNKIDTGETCVTFWNHVNNERYLKVFDEVFAIRGTHEYCLIVGRKDILRTTIRKSFKVILCNNLGTVLTSKEVNFVPTCAEISNSFIILSDRRNIYVWRYNVKTLSCDVEDYQAWVNVLKPDSLSNEREIAIEQMLDIQDESSSPAKAVIDYVLQFSNVSSKNGIVSIFIADTIFAVALRTGVIHIFSLASIKCVQQVSIPSIPVASIQLNCNSSKLSAIDESNVLHIFDFEIPSLSDEGDLLQNIIILEKNLSRKDCWTLKWSSDKPYSCAYMIKNNLIILEVKDMTADELFSIKDVHLSCFSNLNVTLVVLDKLRSLSHQSLTKDQIFKVIHSKCYQDGIDLLLSSKLKQVEKFTIFNNQKCKGLLKMVAYDSLEKLDFQTAEKAFVTLENYKGIIFCQNQILCKDKIRQEADLMRFLGKLEEAEKSYCAVDRQDLAVEMRLDHGNWMHVVKLSQHIEAQRKWLRHHVLFRIGERMEEQGNWSQAAKYFIKTKEIKKAFTNLFRSNDFGSMEKIAYELNDGNLLLLELAKSFHRCGLHTQAIRCYRKFGDMKLALDNCYLLNCWEDALDISKTSGLTTETEKIITQRINSFLAEDNILQAVITHRLCNKADKASYLLSQLAHTKGAVPLWTKKMHTFAAREVERCREKVMDLKILGTIGANEKSVDKAVALCTTIMNIDSGEKDYVKASAVWHSASAFHYILLAHRQIYAGNYERAMKTAIRCSKFDDVLNPLDIYCVLALASYYSGYFGVCSKALRLMQSLPFLKQDHVKSIQQLLPQDNDGLSACYVHCLERSTNYHACTFTGCSILNKYTIQCKYCRHYMIIEKTSKIQPNCHLCHAPQIQSKGKIFITSD